MKKPPPPRDWHKRQWLKCNRCGRPAYYDFSPYSVSDPVMKMPCGHGSGTDHATAITEVEAMAIIDPPTSAPQ